MRKLIIILLLIPLQLFATKYYVKNTGSDGNTGLSNAQAWQTISKVNGFTFAAGDTVYFNKGDVWRETLNLPRSGTAGTYMLFTGYGTGVNPRILGSVATTTWTNTSGNLWRTNITFTNPRNYPADIYFNNSGTITWGAYKTTTGGCTAEYNWTWSGNYIYVYAASDPASRYTGVEIPQRYCCVDTYHRQYIHFDGIDCLYAGYIGYDDNSSHTDHIAVTGMIIENCTIAYIGGITSTQAGFGIATPYTNLIVRNCTIHDCGRRGISLDIYGSGFTATNALIEQNTMYGGFHTTAIDISVGSGSYTGGWNGITIRRNLIYDVSTAPYTFNSNQIFLQDFNPGSGALNKNINIYSNIFRYPNGTSVALEGVDSIRIYNNTFFEGSVQSPYTIQFWIDANCTHIKAKNNIFYSSNSNALYGWGIYCVSAYANIDLDYNLYYRTSTSLREISYNGTLYYTNTITTTLRSNYGWETHCPTPANPNFVSTSNLTLQAGSPAINAGTPVSVVSDYAGNAFDLTHPSIGAYEYNYNPPVSVESIAVTGTGGATTISAPNGTLQMIKKTLPTNANDTTCTWSILDGTGHATINSTGLVSAVADGTVTLRATANDGSGIYGTLELIVSNQPNPAIPGVETIGVFSSYKAICAIVSANVFDDGDGTVSERGVCVGTSTNPTTANTKFESGMGTGEYSCVVYGLKSGTTYHARAYAINETGTSYGSDIQFTTRSYSVNYSGGKVIRNASKKIIIVR